MPFPIVIAAVIGLIALVGGATVALNWDAIITALKGKKVAILGARGVGKTRLIKFLTTGSIPEEYRQTMGTEKTSPRRFQLRELDLNIKEIHDVSGNKSAYGEWKKIIDEADVVFYLLRADLLKNLDPETEYRVKKDVNHISDWMENKNNKSHLFIVGTHCDLDPEFNHLTPEKLGDYSDRFQKNPVVQHLLDLAGGTQRATVALGSLQSIEKTEFLVHEIFSQIVQK